MQTTQYTSDSLAYHTKTHLTAFYPVYYLSPCSKLFISQSYIVRKSYLSDGVPACGLQSYESSRNFCAEFSSRSLRRGRDTVIASFWWLFWGLRSLTLYCSTVWSSVGRWTGGERLLLGLWEGSLVSVESNTGKTCGQWGGRRSQGLTS